MTKIAFDLVKWLNANALVVKFGKHARFRSGCRKTCGFKSR